MAKVLVAGWFSYEGAGATAGDLLVQRLVCEWLAQAGRPCDVAFARPFAGGVDWRAVDPAAYSDVLFVCGPFKKHAWEQEFLARFPRSRKVGVNLSMFEPLGAWSPFDLLWERDSDRTSRPDLSILTDLARVPVVVRCLVHPQEEYGDRAMHDTANAAIARLIASREMALVDVDTRLDVNATQLRTPAEVESLIARADVVLTTRLHGTVLALKNGVPAVAVDPVRGGAKILRQARTIGWPQVFTADAVTDAALAEAYAYCLTPEARRAARDCADRAREAVRPVRDEFIRAMGAPRSGA